MVRCSVLPGWPPCLLEFQLVPLDNAEKLRDIAASQGNRLEVFRGDRAGQHSIRINAQWRICFRWTDDGPFDVEIVDYH